MLEKVSEKPVTIESKLRKAVSYQWVEDLFEKTKQKALYEKRTEKKAAGPKLEPIAAQKISDEIEQLQQQINVLLGKQDELKKKLVAHWGHTGVEEIEGSLGNTLITVSMSMCVDPDMIKQHVTTQRWIQLTRRVIEVPALLSKALSEKNFRPVIGRALVAANVKVSVVPPSSRRSKSGDTQGEE